MESIERNDQDDQDESGKNEVKSETKADVLLPTKPKKKMTPNQLANLTKAHETRRENAKVANEIKRKKKELSLIIARNIRDKNRKKKDILREELEDVTKQIKRLQSVETMDDAELLAIKNENKEIDEEETEEEEEEEKIVEVKKVAKQPKLIKQKAVKPKKSKKSKKVESSSESSESESSEEIVEDSPKNNKKQYCGVLSKARMMGF